MTETVFLIDDDEAPRGLGEVVIKMAGYEVRSFESPQDLFPGKKITEATPMDFRDAFASAHALVTDNNMPYMNGTDLVAKVREAEIYIPVLVVSGKYVMFREELDALAKAHKFDIWEKPYDVRKLMAWLKDKIPVPKPQ